MSSIDCGCEVSASKVGAGKNLNSKVLGRWLTSIYARNIFSPTYSGLLTTSGTVRC